MKFSVANPLLAIHLQVAMSEFDVAVGYTLLVLAVFAMLFGLRM